MKKVLAILLLSGAALAADTFHVSTVRNLQPTDPAPVSRAFRVFVIVGTVGHTRYTTQQIHGWGAADFEVGKDYVVIKSDAKSLTVIVPGKKRDIKERLDIVSAEETGQ